MLIIKIQWSDNIYHYKLFYYQFYHMMHSATFPYSGLFDILATKQQANGARYNYNLPVHWSFDHSTCSPCHMMITGQTGRLAAMVFSPSECAMWFYEFLTLTTDWRAWAIRAGVHFRGIMGNAASAGRDKSESERDPAAATAAAWLAAIWLSKKLTFLYKSWNQMEYRLINTDHYTYW